MRKVGRAALYGVLAGLATAAVAEAVRPRGGMSVLVDWNEVRRAARARLDGSTTSAATLVAAQKRYRAMAAQLEKPLLDFVGGLPAGARLPRFDAVDRDGWLDLNLEILRRVMDPVLEQGQIPNSLIAEVGRAGVDRYVGFMLGFLGRRVLGQFDPQLLGAEPVAGEGLYLVETNVEDWAQKAELPGEDLRRWLILHEMTHAWQFAAHPWLRADMESSIRALLESTTRKAPPAARIAAFAGVVPAQWKIMRRMQGTMSLVEGYSNLVMNELGAELLPGFAQLEKAYRARSTSRSVLEMLIWKLSGLDLKLQQYSRGEAFAKAVYDAHGMQVLNLAWRGPDSMPRVEELANPEAWYRRVAVKPLNRS
ncbi:MAG TPA: zinc-dependent metalloprotease [Candidatus Dormibacteraeota bacterium]|nr:zinc-dependent metalloprotease [Candidatus Dormibacteraeota bacterium]